MGETAQRAHYNNKDLRLVLPSALFFNTVCLEVYVTGTADVTVTVHSTAYYVLLHVASLVPAFSH